ncbi:MAG TPA: hypothetical protein PL048_02695 [Leptospiraceae bacterium]|nr:hypothetical protein [Leptospiraceae bacterium]HMZ57654.1 hypothetical protein [Leptospiraceae bacterium]HNF16041.1 hypothetical protein [Leptospiraceae bacterium]HNM05328.1 hypothetical protein [Leptospiraceae bacterium]HNN01937.1 hypothetical protein [Leptospiraceae bacterium]
MSIQETISRLAEFLELQTRHQNLDVLIHNFETENGINRIQHNDNISILNTDQIKFLDSFAGFLSIRSSEREYAKFRTYCSSENTPENELRNRIREIEENPEIGVSWEEAVSRLEVRIGKKVKITSKS